MKKRILTVIVMIFILSSFILNVNAIHEEFDGIIGESILAEATDLNKMIPSTIMPSDASSLYTFGISGTFDYDEATDVLSQLNTLRAGLSLPALVMDEALLEAAMQRAAETAIYWDHFRPDGSTCFTAFPNNYRSAGENIAWGQANAAAVMTSWTNSQGHYNNMVSIDFNAVGIGCFYQDGQKYWVQLFTGGSTPTVSTKSGKQTEAKTVTSLGDILVLSLTPTSATLEAYSSYNFSLYSTFNAGLSRAINIKIIPSFYETANTNIATVNSSGTVTGVSAGYTVLRLGVGSDFYKEAGLSVNPAQIVKGDIFTDGVIDSKDLVKLAQYLAGWQSAVLSNAELGAADVQADGIIDSKDLVKLGQYLAGWQVSLG